MRFSLMNFASDNWAGATEAVMAAVQRHNGGFAPGYGGDGLTRSVGETFSRAFEREVEVFFVGTGTAANGISMAAAGRPGGLVFATSEAHINNDEFGATEFYSGGMKIIPVADHNGIMDAAALEATIARYGGRFGLPTALSLTNATECGTVYGADAVAELAEIGKRHGLTVHMDGARFANAVAALNASPAEVTWKAGVDILSFGGTKNGCMAAEAIVVFEPGKFPNLPAIRQRAGHTASKARFIAAQFEGYFEDGGWLKTAKHANEMAARLATGLSKKASLGWASAANEVFAVLPKATIGRLREAGAMFYEWPAEGLAADEELVRLVTSFATMADEVERFLGLL
jgi:threonine aldolase